MKLGTLECGGWREISANSVEFSLPGTFDELIDEIKALNNTDLVLYDDDDRPLASYLDYHVTGIDVEGTSDIRLTMARNIDSTIEETVAALESNMDIVSNKVDRIKTFSENNAIPDYVRNAARIMVAKSVNISSGEVGSIMELIPMWETDISYKQGQLVKYEDKIYRLAQDTTSTDIYKPGTGTESLYTLIDIAEDGVRVWHMPTDATNSFALGELAHYPTASDPIYRSKRNGNTSEPTTDAWWELVE